MTFEEARDKFLYIPQKMISDYGISDEDSAVVYIAYLQALESAQKSGAKHLYQALYRASKNAAVKLTTERTKLIIEYSNEIDGGEYNSDEIAFDNDLHEKLQDALASLTPQQEMVLRMRYEQEMTLQEVGDVMGISGMSVRQIEAKALRRLRHPINSKAVLQAWRGTGYRNPRIPETPKMYIFTRNDVLLFGIHNGIKVFRARGYKCYWLGKGDLFYSTEKKFDRFSKSKAFATAEECWQCFKSLTVDTSDMSDTLTKFFRDAMIADICGEPT